MGTGPTTLVRIAVLARAGDRCELCNQYCSANIHHRRPRGMGGSRSSWMNTAENLLALCGSGTMGCHGYVESNRSRAYESGWLLRSGMFPWETPFVDLSGLWWLLDGNLKRPITLPFQNPGSGELTGSEVGSSRPSEEREGDDRPHHGAADQRG